MNVTIDLPMCPVGSLPTIPPPVSATIIDVAAHLACVATFAVHRATLGDLYRGEWAVTNVETGCGVAYGQTRGTAIANAVEKLRVKTVAEVLEAYKRATKIRRANGYRSWTSPARQASATATQPQSDQTLKS